MSMKEKLLFNFTTTSDPNIGEGGVAYSLLSRDYKDMQCVAIENHPADSRVKISDDGSSDVKQPNGYRGGNVPMVMEGENMEELRYIVRRLTPLECERLQGFPDGWTDIGDWTDSKGKIRKGESDAPRYKALGNSIALPFWKWMAERMVNALKEEGVGEPTMASLFDGIGGFPLVYSEVGCKPIWASEIEEFPIAVTKIRFPEEVDDEVRKACNEQNRTDEDGIR